jgi:hypothetical protein
LNPSKSEFQRILFLSALNAVTCDGEISPEEILELDRVLNETNYLNGYDANSLLVDLMNKNSSFHFTQLYFQELEKYRLTIGDKLLIMEVIFRILRCNNIQHDNAIAFVRFIQQKLRLPDFELRLRFGYERPFEPDADDGHKFSNITVETHNVPQDEFKELILFLHRKTQGPDSFG